MIRTRSQKRADDVTQFESLVPSDDVVALRDHLRLESLHYIDVGQEKAWEEALSSWPLLKECSRWQEK